jgi:DNA-binding response OmpR family regulator
MESTSYSQPASCLEVVPPDTKIVIIESSEVQTKTFLRILKALGYSNIRTCATAEEAFAVLSSEGAELVFCDWQLPDLPGVEILREVRSNAQAHELPFIFVTALTEKSKVAEISDLNVTDVLVKPLSSAVVDQKLRHLKINR